eukprot:CAMPEP_0197038282 /NCGR_PEP_ID=MMETSP1384-20130603/15239_1 /TAXON_ID=29189 /ORGANISM="Ammonia sp." /LENGTH=417 /DNA_ID=CAMNT_0042468695 /DNA_START=72 /DNA_END=1325 /DNA_ORIENTATION=+
MSNKSSPSKTKPVMLKRMDPTATAKRSSTKLTIPQSVDMEQFTQFVREITQISAQQDPIDVAYIVIAETCKTLRCDRSSFFFVDGDFLDLVIAKGVDSIRMPKTSGFAGLCATTGKMINIPDAYDDDRFNDTFDKKNNYRTKQILACPIIDEQESNEVIGVLQCINKNDDSPFDAIDESLLSCLSHQIAVAMRYAIQMEEARKATRQKEALISYIRNMNANTNVPSLLFTLNKAAQELLEADRCTFYTINHDAETLHLINTDAAIDITLKLSQGIAGSVATSGRKVNIPDCYKDDRFDPSFDKQTGYKTISMLVMPVFADAHKSKEKPIAVVQLINRNKGDSAFSKNDEEILSVLLRFVGPVIKDSALFVKKKKATEAKFMSDLSAHQMARQPSKTFTADLDAMVIEEEEEDEFKDD